MPTYTHRVAFTSEGDLFIIQGPAKPVLFISQDRIDDFVNDPNATPTTEVNSELGVALFHVAVDAGATFSRRSHDRPPTSHPDTFILWMNFANGLGAVYVDQDDLLSERLWFFSRKAVIVVAPFNFVLSEGGPTLLSKYTRDISGIGHPKGELSPPVKSSPDLSIAVKSALHQFNQQ